jgi:hypothetical protein
MPLHFLSSLSANVFLNQEDVIPIFDQIEIVSTYAGGHSVENVTPSISGQSVHFVEVSDLPFRQLDHRFVRKTIKNRINDIAMFFHHSNFPSFNKVGTKLSLTNDNSDPNCFCQGNLEC